MLIPFCATPYLFCGLYFCFLINICRFPPLLQGTHKYSGMVEDCCCDYESVNHVNVEVLHPSLQELVKTPFFRYFKVCWSSLKSGISCLSIMQCHWCCGVTFTKDVPIMCFAILFEEDLLVLVCLVLYNLLVLVHLHALAWDASQNNSRIWEVFL